VPIFLGYFGVACLALVLVTLSISRIPFGIGDLFSKIIYTTFWLLVFRLLVAILHSPFSP
jgi:hypothetical protein